MLLPLISWTRLWRSFSLRACWRLLNALAMMLCFAGLALLVCKSSVSSAMDQQRSEVDVDVGRGANAVCVDSTLSIRRTGQDGHWRLRGDN